MAMSEQVVRSWPATGPRFPRSEIPKQETLPLERWGESVEGEEETDKSVPCTQPG